MMTKQIYYKKTLYKTPCFKFIFQEEPRNQLAQTRGVKDGVKDNFPKLWFRISRKCANAVKRNHIKRVIREFVRAHASIFPEVILIQIYKEHLIHQSDWNTYIHGVQYELAQFAQRQSGKIAVSQYVQDTATYHALSA